MVDMTVLVATAFVAGMISTLNPCGFAMLPAYLGWLLAAGPEDGTRVLRVAATVGAGLLGVLTLTGVVISAGVRSVVGWIPWMALMVGTLLVVAGVAQLAGRRWLPTIVGPRRAGVGKSTLAMAGFGASYALASLSCTLPIFLSLVVAPVTAQSLLESAAVFVAYGAGMVLVVLVLTVAVAAGRARLIGSVRGIGRRLDRASGVVQLLAGGFIVWYWATVLSAGPVAAASNGLARWLERTSARLAGAAVGHVLVVAAIGFTVMALAVLGSRAAHRGAASDRDGPAVADESKCDP